MSWVEKNWKPLTVVGGLLGLSWFAGKRFERAEKPTQELRDYEETFVEVQTDFVDVQKENEQKEPYYEVMVDIDSLDNLGDGEPFDGLTLELQNPLGGGRYILSLDYGEGGDEPLMTPSEAIEDYRNQIGITTYSYEPDWDEDTEEWVGSENTNIWVGTINFPTGKQGEGGEFYARVFGFKDDESESDAENVIMKHITDTIELNVRQRDEEDGMFYPIDYFAETFDAERIKWDYVVHREPKGTKIGKDGKRIPNPKGGWFKSVKDAETFDAEGMPFGVHVKNHKTTSTVFYKRKPFRRFRGSRHKEKAESYAQFMEKKLKSNPNRFSYFAETFESQFRKLGSGRHALDFSFDEMNVSWDEIKEVIEEYTNEWDASGLGFGDVDVIVVDRNEENLKDLYRDLEYQFSGYIAWEAEPNEKSE